jgi:hypothetical protein
LNRTEASGRIGVADIRFDLENYSELSIFDFEPRSCTRLLRF